jgi:uncharacterized protein (TIGR03435 family)
MIGWFGVCALLVAAPPRFDVASIKVGGEYDPHDYNRKHGGPGTSDPGRVTYAQMPLNFLILTAYGLQNRDQIAGPAWMSEADRFFTVTATMPPDTTPEQLQLMLQNLLAERFHLAVHHETRSFPGYELTVASGGPRFHEWVPGADSFPADPGDDSYDKQGFPHLAVAGKGVVVFPPPGRWRTIRTSQRTSIPAFLLLLGSFVNYSNGEPSGVPTARVVDKTGLTGVYEFRLGFEGKMPVTGEPPGETTPSDPGDGGPNLFTALETQLGLTLVKARSVAVDMLVIDRLDKVPTEN